MRFSEPQYDCLFKIIRVSVSGIFEDQDMLACIESTARLVEQTGCQRVLVDARDAILMLREASSLQRFIAFERKFDPAYRVAVAYQQIGPRQRRFEARATAKNLPLRVFASEWQALDWLLEAYIKV
jgi:hypothetical protein